MAASRGTERHVPDFDVCEELEVLRAQGPRCFDELKPRLGRERHSLPIDLNDLPHTGHLDNSSVRGCAGRQGVIATHRPDRTRVPLGISQDRLNLRNGARRHELRGKGCDPTIVILDHVSHLSYPAALTGSQLDAARHRISGSIATPSSASIVSGLSKANRNKTVSPMPRLGSEMAMV